MGPLLSDFCDRGLKYRHGAGDFTKAVNHRTVAKNKGFVVSQEILGSHIGPVLLKCVTLAKVYNLAVPLVFDLSSGDTTPIFGL